MHKLFSAAAFALAAPVLAAAPAHANSIGVQPLIVIVNPGQSAAVSVRNSADTSSTVETRVSERVIDATGVQVRKPADDDFIVFPPQATIKAQGTQVFRIQPLQSDLTASKSYFLTVQQVPVAFKPTERAEGGAQIQVLFAFDVAVHVVPRGAKPNMELVSIAPGETTVTTPPSPEALADLSKPPAPTVTTVPGAVIEIHNSGNRYLYLQDYDYAISAVLEDGSTTEFPRLTEREVINAAGVTLVLPGASRTFRLPLPEGVKVRSLSVKVSERGVA